MKKLLCMAFAVVCLSACGGGEKEAKTMTCKLEKAVTGLKTQMDMDIEYRGTTVTKQTQNSIITADSQEVYDVMVPELKTYSKEDAFKGMEGVTYSLIEDAKKLNMVEKITIDFDKISADDYKKVSGDSSIDLSKNKIVLDKTKEKLEGQGFNCKK